MPQTVYNQFPADLIPPQAWIDAVDGKRIGDWVWCDSSWGNDAAPSWRLEDTYGGRACMVAYYTTVENREFPIDDMAEYVCVSPLDAEGEMTAEYVDVTPAQFVAALVSATSSDDFYAQLKIAAADSRPRPLALLETVDLIAAAEMRRINGVITPDQFAALHSSSRYGESLDLIEDWVAHLDFSGEVADRMISLLCEAHGYGDPTG